MCRWFVYLAEEPILIADAVLRPKHSIVKQIDDHFLPDIHVPFQASDSGSSPNALSNLDGFGVGFYNEVHSDYDPAVPEGLILPCVYKSVRPPLNEMNLNNLADNLETKCLFAHVRAGGSGMTPTVETNCHPYKFGPFLFQHNGMLANFSALRLSILSLLTPPNLLSILGTTDSEHIAALYFSNLGFDPSSPASSWKQYTLEELGDAMKKTIKDLDELVIKHGGYGESHSSLNLAVTDGRKIVCTRWRGGKGDEPPSLYWSTEAGPTLNRKFPDHPDGDFAPSHHRKGGSKPVEHHGKHIIIASEPSTYIQEQWHLIPRQSLLLVDKEYRLNIVPM